MWVSAYLSRLGLSLLQSKAVGDEAVAGQQLMMQLGADLSEISVPWVWTGDAAHTESQTAKAILPKGGTTPSLKNNQAELKDWAEHLMRYPVDDEHAYHR